MEAFVLVAPSYLMQVHSLILYFSIFVIKRTHCLCLGNTFFEDKTQFQFERKDNV